MGGSDDRKEVKATPDTGAPADATAKHQPAEDEELIKAPKPPTPFRPKGEVPGEDDDDTYPHPEAETGNGC